MMTTKIKSTNRQKLAVKLISENSGKPMGALLKEAGYTEETSLSPTSITKGIGFIAEMERSGLTKKLIADALTEDIQSKKGNRVGELMLGAKILKMTSEDVEREDSPTLNIVVSEVHNNDNRVMSNETEKLENVADNTA